MSKAAKGRIVSQVTRDRLRIANTGKKRTPEQLFLMTQVRKGIKLSEEHKRKISIAKIGKKQSLERRLAATGRKHTEEEKQRMKLAAALREKIECPFCNVSARPGPYGRWHGNNCKLKQTQVASSLGPQHETKEIASGLPKYADFVI